MIREYINPFGIDEEWVRETRERLGSLTDYTVDGDFISGPIFDGGDVLESSIQSAMVIAARYMDAMREAGMMVYDPTITMDGCYCDLCNMHWLKEDGQDILAMNASRPSVILLPPDETPDQEPCQIFQPVSEEEYHHECPNHDVIVRWVQPRP